MFLRGLLVSCRSQEPTQGRPMRQEIGERALFVQRGATGTAITVQERANTFSNGQPRFCTRDCFPTTPITLKALEGLIQARYPTHHATLDFKAGLVGRPSRLHAPCRALNHNATPAYIPVIITLQLAGDLRETGSAARQKGCHSLYQPPDVGPKLNARSEASDLQPREP